MTLLAEGSGRCVGGRAVVLLFVVVVSVFVVSVVSVVFPRVPWWWWLWLRYTSGGGMDRMRLSLAAPQRGRSGLLRLPSTDC